MAFPFSKLSPVARISLGLVSQMATIVLLIAIVFGVMPDRIESARQLRTVLSESLALQTAYLLQMNDPEALQDSLEDALERHAELRSLALKNNAGDVIAQAGPHVSAWHAPEDGGNKIDNMRIPIMADNATWGEVQFSYRHAHPQSLGEWLRYPPITALVLITLTGMGTFYLYLRRVLEYLDPLAVIPERVRTAYDTFHDAILVIDPNSKIVLANSAFRKLHPTAREPLVGKPVASLTWLTDSLPTDNPTPPWVWAMRNKVGIDEAQMSIPQPNGAHTIEVMLNCTPIIDGYGQSRGSMLVLSDVTALHRSNHDLRIALDKLAASNALIEEKNRELETLATRDPMTGCLNRRALYELIEPLFETIRDGNGELCCAMCDIDFFKKFNDTYGHAIGDLVIKAFARTLGAGLRDADILCRFGGEEFCIFLPGVSSDQAWQIVERLRIDVDHEAGRSIRDHEGLHITASFGISSIKQGAADPDAMIQLADEALYYSKQNGRNRVTVWQPEHSMAGTDH